MNGLLSGLILFSSFAMRTPNNPDITKDDYEISFGLSNDTTTASLDRLSLTTVWR